jgi:hypothetical protein
LLLLLISMEWDCLWTATTKGLLFILQMIHEHGEPMWNEND